MLRLFFSINFLLGGFICFVAGLIVYLNNKERQVNRSWFFLSLCAGTWSIGHFLLSVSQSHQTALFFAYFLYIPAIFIPPMFLYFVFSLLGEASRRKWELFAAFVVSFAILILLPSDAFLSGV